MTSTAQLVIASSLFCVEIAAVMFSVLYVPPIPMLFYPSDTRVRPSDQLDAPIISLNHSKAFIIYNLLTNQVRLVCHTDWRGMIIPFAFVLFLMALCTYYAILTRSQGLLFSRENVK